MTAHPSTGAPGANDVRATPAAGSRPSALLDLLTTLHRLDPASADAIAEIATERLLQITRGYTPERDDRLESCDFAAAAAVCAISAAPLHFAELLGSNETEDEWRDRLNVLWPWSATPFKPGGPDKDLIRAGALAVAGLARRFRSPDGVDQDGEGAAS